MIKEVATFLRSIIRSPDSHKGDNGRVLVIAGSKDYTGAAYLAASSIACLRTGTDLVTLAAPEKVAWVVNNLSPDVITLKLPGDYLIARHFDRLKHFILKSDVVLIGPGIGTKAGTLVELVVSYCVSQKKQMVIDADAIKLVDITKLENAILTPHHAEYLKIKGKDIGSNVILLKGKIDKIITKDKVYENKTGNSGMTVGGTGDVLAGICAGLLCQSKDLVKSSCAAAYINGAIGDKLKKKYSNGFIATDFLSEIAEMIKDLKAKY